MAPVAPVISPALARALEAGRSRYNARARAARKDGARLDPDAVARHLATRVDACVAAVAAVRPDRADAVLDALFDATLDQIARGLVGALASRPAVDDVWSRVLPAAPRALADDPARVVTSLSHAGILLAGTPGVRFAAWVEALARVGPIAPKADDLLGAGVVLAWTAGLAHAREAAVRAWSALPDDLARGVFARPGVPAPPRDALARDLLDPWRKPGTPRGAPRLATFGTVGDFEGFGGSFVEPPRVVTRDTTIYAFDRASCWRLHADAFGATLRPFGAVLPGGAIAPEAFGAFVTAPTGWIRRGEVEARFEALAGFSSATSDGRCLAVTLPDSHRIRLVALTDDAA